MPTHRRNIRRRSACSPSLISACVGLAAALTGCSSADKTERTTVSAGDFQAAPVPRPAPEPQAAATTAPPPAAPAVQPAPARRPLSQVPVMAVSSTPEGVMDVTSHVGKPQLADSEPPATSAPIMFDALVGQINGRPVYASTFLDQLDAQLRANKSKFPDPQAWKREAENIIKQTLAAKVRNDLVLAEALASLTPDMKEQGIRYVLGQIRGDLVRQNQGSAETANSKYLENDNLTLDQKAREGLNAELAKAELIKHVMPMANVSSREIRDFYRRNFDRFNLPGEVSLRVIRVAADDSDGVKQVTDLLDTGVPFEEAAKLPVNSFNRDTGGLRLIKLDPDPAQTKFFGVAELNEQALRLQSGETAGPITYSNSLYWIHVERVSAPRSISLYDAQLDISSSLRNRKVDDALGRYYERLLKRGSFSDIKVMTDRLLEIATERYYGNGA